MRITSVYFAFFSWAVLSTTMASAWPCPDLGISEGEVTDKADWIIEGRVTRVQPTGTFGDCEDVTHACGQVAKPEAVILLDVKVIKGHPDTNAPGAMIVYRKSHCFSGFLSSMNSKPELNAVGQRVRLFGNDSRTVLPFVQPGYFFIQLLTTAK